MGLCDKSFPINKMLGLFGSPADSKGVLGFDRMFFDLQSTVPPRGAVTYIVYSRVFRKSMKRHGFRLNKH